MIDARDVAPMAVQREKIAFLHIPKTGGRALEKFFQTLHPNDPHWYFSFFGLDLSQGANRVLVEAMVPGDEAHRQVAANPHFQNATVVAGHFAANLEEFFPEYSFRYVTILREPIERAISNIYQYTWAPRESRAFRFAGRPVPDRVGQPRAYWAAVAEILRLAQGGPIEGLWPHEAMMLTNGMTRMLSGAPLHTFTSQVSVRTALRNAATMEVAWFSDFNATVSRALANLGVPLILDGQNNPVGVGLPTDHLTHQRDFGCPAEVRHFVAHLNQSDIELYRTLQSS